MAGVRSAAEERKAYDDLVRKIKVGSVWQRKKDGSLVRITALKNHARPTEAPFYDISWENIGGPRRRTGQSYMTYWLKNNEPHRHAVIYEEDWITVRAGMRSTMTVHLQEWCWCGQFRSRTADGPWAPWGDWNLADGPIPGEVQIAVRRGVRPVREEPDS